jgi:hypothetical protein
MTLLPVSSVTQQEARISTFSPVFYVLSGICDKKVSTCIGLGETNLVINVVQHERV